MGLGATLASLGRGVRRRRPVEDLITEDAAERFERRAVSGPALLLLTPAYAAAFPWILGGAALLDASTGRRWTRTRFAAVLGVNIGMHSAAFLGLFGSWLVGGQWMGASPGRERRLTHRLQRQWARWTWELSSRLYEMKLEAVGLECLDAGPVLILPRHTSLVDTLLPLILAEKARPDQALRLHYVMKHELLWDPVLDALGHRWPTAFVKRGTGDPEQVAHVRELGRELSRRDGVVLFPEGTRFSTAKRERILDSLRRKHPERVPAAEAMEHLLPPHPAGVLAILQAFPCDVVFVAHDGLQGANHFEDLLAGSLIGKTVRVQMWRVPYAEIPPGADARRRWLEEEWLRVEEWIREGRKEEVTD